jgi:hypothetical protein
MNYPEKTSLRRKFRKVLYSSVLAHSAFIFSVEMYITLKVKMAWSHKIVVVAQKFVCYNSEEGAYLG